jgi:hypothetical protein
MSNGLGRYHFLAWARRGIGASLANPDYGASLPARANLNISLTVSAQGPSPASQPVPPVTVDVFGPGDVLGIDPRHVVRTEPKPFTTNFEPNYLAGIEFDDPDLPWLFTPAAPAANRLRPWLALIVLKSQEFAPAPNVTQPLPAIDVNALAALQPLDDSWNWVHIQVSGDAGLDATLAAAPGSVISRLLCPRRLDPETSYTAFLVPAFEIGRQAGLGQDVSGVTNSAPAWIASTPTPLRLPIYYSFQFHTSDQGDFESLVRQLTPRKLGSGIGQRPMSIDTPLADFPSAGPPLGLQGALESLAVTPTPWNDPDKTNFQTALQAFVNLTTPVTDDPAHPNPQDPTVVPPIYGRWHAGIATVSRTSTGWLDGLNLDPRNRTESGMGTQVVQAHLTQLLASAWQQVAGIELANSILRRAQLARGTLSILHAQKFAVASNATLLSFIAPIHSRILASSQTVRATVAASRVPVRMFAGAFRRITSPAGVIRRRQIISGAAIGSLVNRVNANEIAIIPTPTTPGGLVAIEDISDSLAPKWARYFPIEIVGRTPVATFRATIDIDRARNVITIGNISPQTVSTVPPRPGFAISPPGVQPPSGPGVGTVDSVEAADFRRALLPLAAALQAPQPDLPLAAPLDMQTLRDSIVTRIDPTVTVPARILSTINISALLGWSPSDPIQPIMAAPQFPQPMYAPLRDLSPQYILPGVDQIPPDTVGLLQSNHAFIEAYMVGLNHEMARQLLWAGYPTDLRPSCFRQFWDVSNYVPQPGDRTDPAELSEMLKDIPPIHTWPLADPLGTHENRTGIVPDNVVLIIRGELLRRYPNTIIYAAKAKVADGKRIIDESDERYPIFGGSLPTDITFIGFNLSVADAKGGPGSATPEGFFFVFQQHPTEPRFGLEPAASGTVQHWADLAWTNFATMAIDAAAAPRPMMAEVLQIVGPLAPWQLASQVFAGILASFPLPDFLSASANPSGVLIVNDADDPNDTANAWGVDAAQTAYITLRMPYRIAIHADLMVPT